jgi:hypothetical protein
MDSSLNPFKLIMILVWGDFFLGVLSLDDPMRRIKKSENPLKIVQLPREAVQERLDLKGLWVLLRWGGRGNILSLKIWGKGVPNLG